MSLQLLASRQPWSPCLDEKHCHEHPASLAGGGQRAETVRATGCMIRSFIRRRDGRQKSPTEGGFDFRAGGPRGAGAYAALRLVADLAAVPVSLNLVGDLLAFGEAAHPGPLDRADVHEVHSGYTWRVGADLRYGAGGYHGSSDR